MALPLRDEEPYFSNSREVTLNNFLALERRLLKILHLLKNTLIFYKKLVTTDVISNKYFYIPYHCVYIPD